MSRLALLLAPLVFSTSVFAELRLPSVFGDRMVLQRETRNTIWGWAAPGAPVWVTIDDQAQKTKAGANGRWQLQLDPIAGSHHALEMTVTSRDEKIHFSNILIGDVWICSGQSNMQFSVAQAYDAELEIPTAVYPSIRLLDVPKEGSQENRDDFEGRWEMCSPDTVANFSAVGYYFGRRIHNTTGIPIGLVDIAYGGSAAEAWVDRALLESLPQFRHYIDQWVEIETTYDRDAELEQWKNDVRTARAAGKEPPRWPQDKMTGQQRPGNIRAGVLNPILGYGIKGALWYQGESNSWRAWQYRDLFSLMITEWRKAQGQGDFPFYFAQLADYKKQLPTPSEGRWAELREAQTETLSLPNTAMAVLYDLGEGRDIHPRNKIDVAKRLARIALARDYGMEVDYLSPQMESVEISDGVVTVTFENVSDGLYAFDTVAVRGFSLAGEDRVWHNAEAAVRGTNEVTVSSKDVPAPIAVRYAWADNPDANLETRTGLPAIPFRTDDWPIPGQPLQPEP